jgi:uroporphyrinogen-III synthase
MGLVSLRPTGEAVAEDGLMTQLARAEAALRADDLAGAVGTLQPLEGAAAAAAADWLGAARARLAADQAVAATTARAISRLDGANDGG